MADAASFFVWNALTKVLHVIPTLERGGAERSLAHLVTDSTNVDRSLIHHIATFSPDGVFRQQLEAAGIEITTLNIGSAFSFPLGVWRLRRLIRKWRPDVIQGWLYYGDLAATFARAISRTPRPRLFWNIRCSDLDFEAYHPVLKMAARVEARLSFAPEAIVVNSDVGARAHEALGFQPDKFVLIHNGVDTDQFVPDAGTRVRVRKQLGFIDDEKIILHAARVDPQKNHDMLIEVARQLPQYQFLAAGRGTETLDGPENLTLLGDQKDIAALMNAADVLISTSSYGEGFPNVIAEAMSCGTPTVSTDCGDAKEIIGDIGAVVAKNDVQAAVIAIKSIIDPDEAGSKPKPDDLRSRIVNNFSLEKCHNTYALLWK